MYGSYRIQALLTIALGWLLAIGAQAAVPPTVCIQGVLTDTDGKALQGDRAWRVQYYDAPAGGQSLGTARVGALSVGKTGRWSVSLMPPAEVLSASGEVWYELAIDSEVTPDGAIDDVDVFVSRVQVESVLFAQLARDAEMLGGLPANDFITSTRLATVLVDDYVTSGALAAGLAGKSDTGHLHDNRYYTETESDAALAGKSDTGHGHNLQNLGGAVTDAQVPDNITIDHATSADSAIHASSADSATTAGVALALAAPSEPSDVLVTSGTLAAALATKSDLAHLHDERYYTEGESDAALAAGLGTKSDLGHGHDLQNLGGAVTDAQVPDDITVDEAAHAAAADEAAHAALADEAAHAALADEAAHAALADEAEHAVLADEATHAAAADEATHAAVADLATTAAVALSLAGDAADDYATTGALATALATGLATKSDTAHGHDLQNLGGAVTDPQVPNDITINHAAHASNADVATTALVALALVDGAPANEAFHALSADHAELADVALSLAGDAADDYATTGSLVAGLTTKSDTGHGHDLQDLGGAVTDAQVPNDITVDEATHAALADEATHAALADEATHAALADEATHAALADEATHAALADEATHAALADEATHAALADEATHAALADEATHAVLADEATHAVLADEATHAVLADEATHAALADEATHAVLADEATHAATADLATTAAVALSLAGDAADDYATTGALLAGLAAKSDDSHDHDLQDLPGAVTDAQVPDDITIDEAAHAALADEATHAALADEATHAALADEATHAALADEATHAALADEATHAALADEATHAALADEATHAALADEATHAALADEATHAALADEATHAALADEATHAALADEATHAVLADEATHAAAADLATTAAVALSLAGDAAEDYVTTGALAADLAAGLATKSDDTHDHNLQDLPGAVTDAQVPDDITINEAAHAALADEAIHAVLADEATHAVLADEATHAALADEATHAALADEATHAALADEATHAALADEATHAALADEATHAVLADEATHAATADLATTAAVALSLAGDAADDYATTGALLAGLAAKSDDSHDHDLQELPGAVTDAQVPDDITIDEAAHAALADEATHAALADEATHAAAADEATHAALADEATHAAAADEAAHATAADVAAAAMSLIGDAADDYATTGALVSALATKSDTGHGHDLQDLGGAVTDAQVPDTITVNEAAHAAAADEATHAAAADLATTAAVALSLAGDAADDYATTGALLAGLAAKSDDAHLHDDRYYTEAESDAALAAGLATKSDTGHGHDLQDLGGAATDAQIPNDITIDEAAHAAMADEAAHAAAADEAAHAVAADVAATALSLSGDAADDYATTGALLAGLLAKSDTGHGHDLQNLGGTVTDAQVPNDITVDEAAHAALADEATHAAAADMAATALSLSGDAADDYATTGSLAAGLAAKSDTVHDHNDIYYTEGEVDAGLAGKAALIHLHDDRYYTEAESDAALAGKAAAVHGHNLQDLAGTVTDAQVPDNITITEADTLDSVTGRGAATANGIAVGSVDTGQGANELFAMDQNVRTTDDVAFNSIDALSAHFGTNSVSIDDNVIVTGGGKIGVGTTNPTGQIETLGGIAVDQSSLTGALPWAVPAASRAAQVFRAGKTGSLTRVVLSLRHNGTPTTIEVSIISGGSPGLGSAISSVETVNVTDAALTDYTIDFSASADVVNAQKYHIQIKNVGADTMIWGHTNTNPYSGGAIWILNGVWTEAAGSDAYFATYIANGVFIVDTAGKVGIGSLTPDEALDVSGAIKMPDIVTPPATTTARLYNNANDLYWGSTRLNRGLHYVSLATTTSGSLVQTEATLADGVSETVAIHGTAMTWDGSVSKIIIQSPGIYRVSIHGRVQSSGAAGFAGFYQRIKIGGVTQAQTANTVKTAAGTMWSTPVSMEWVGTILQNQSVQCAIDSEDIFSSGSTPDPVAFGPGTTMTVTKLD